MESVSENAFGECSWYSEKNVHTLLECLTLRVPTYFIQNL